MRHISVLLLLILCTLLFPSPSPALAQSPTSESATPSAMVAPEPTAALDVTVSPISLVFDTDPGVSQTETIRIRNNSSVSEYLVISLATFVPDATGEQPVLRDFETSDSYQDWMSFSETSFVVSPGTWKSVDVTFAPPPDAVFNYFYAIIIDRQRTVTPQAGETVITGAPAILSLANVRSPNTIRELQVVSFTTPAVMFEFLPITFSVGVKNTGNTFLAPSGSIFIDGNGVKDVAILSFNPERGNVLPNSQRTYTTSWSDGFPLYVEKIVGGKKQKGETGEQLYELKWDFSQADRLRIGKYTARLLLIYDNGTRDIPIESVVSFWVVPWRILAVALVVGIFSLIGVRATILPLIRTLRRRSSTVAVLVLSCFFTFAGNASADGLAISPIFQELTLEEGQLRTSGTVVLTNTSDAQLTFDLFALDFQQMNRSGKITLSNQPGSQYRLAGYITFPNPTITLLPGQSEEILFYVANTESMSSGGHYAAVVARLVATNASTANQEILPGISSLVLLHKQGDDRYNLSLRPSDLFERFFSFSVPKEIDLTFVNQGNTHVVPRGTIKLFDIFGRTTFRGSINESSYFILPENSRVMSVYVQKTAQTLPIMLYSVQIEGGDRSGSTSFAQQYYIVHISPYVIAALIIGSGFIGVRAYTKQKKNKRLKP